MKLTLTRKMLKEERDILKQKKENQLLNKCFVLLYLVLNKLSKLLQEKKALKLMLRESLGILRIGKKTATSGVDC